MARGRKRLPTKLKVIKGTLEKSRENPNEPKPKQTIPKPKWGLLSKEERKEYDRVAEILDNMKVLTEADVIALEQLAESLALYYEQKDYLEENGYTYSRKNQRGGVIRKPRPEYRIMKDAKKDVLELLARFGLDPSNRSKVVERGEPKDSKW